MNLWANFLLLVLLPVLLAGSAPSATGPSTQPVVESKPVEKDNVAVTLVLQKTTICSDEQPEFIMRLRNIGKQEYRNLYDVTAYWNWTIDLTNSDPRAANGGPWRLHMNAIPLRAYIEHRQIMPGQSRDVMVNLNDPPFTFDYVYAGIAKDAVLPIRHLQPGRYRITAKIALTSPFGPGYFEWIGPVMTEAVELTVTPSQPKTASKEQQEAYDAAIAGVTDKLESGGLWMNGGFPKIDLPNTAKSEDVIDAAVNNTLLDSKAYRILSVKPFARGQMPGEVTGKAALLRLGKTYKVVIFFPMEPTGWWSRFYDTESAS